MNLYPVDPFASDLKYLYNVWMSEGKTKARFHFETSHRGGLGCKMRMEHLHGHFGPCCQAAFGFQHPPQVDGAHSTCPYFAQDFNVAKLSSNQIQNRYPQSQDRPKGRLKIGDCERKANKKIRSILRMDNKASISGTIADPF